MDRSQWNQDLEERIVRYCAIDTPSDGHCSSLPSSECQWDLLRLLEQELKEMGAAEVELLETGYVMATLPSTLGAGKTGEVMALLAHVDTTTQYNATQVKPLVHRDYQGQDIVLPADTSKVLSPSQSSYLASKLGHTIVTASGNSLLGADDKAGVAIIMTLARHLLSHPEIPHADIRVCFTPDEEIGRGGKHLPIEKLAAKAAYTLDGGEVGGLCYETFSAAKAIVKITGVSIHPGTAKDELVNALYLAAKIIQGLPLSTRTPETTEERQGFLHLAQMSGTAAACELHFILRDFELAGLASHEELLRQVCGGVALGEPRATIEVEVTQQYRNMRYGLEKDMTPVHRAAEAYRRCGIEPRFEVLRGGTDGSALTERGLATPNLFTGMQNVHGPLEWVSVQDMAEAVGVCLELAQIWGQGD